MDTREALEQAYRLIQQDRIDDAQALLRPILADDPDNVHAWWLLAYASTDPDEVRRALTTVLALDPDYPNAPKAREMLDHLNLLYPPEETDQVMPASMFTLEDEDFEEALGADLGPVGAPDLFADDEEEVFAAIPEVPDLLPEEDAFAPFADEGDLADEDEVLAVGGPEGDDYELEQMLADLDGEEELLEIAEYEDGAPPARRGSAGRWLLGLAALLIVGAAVVVGAFLLLRERDEDKASPSNEPAALTMQSASSDAVVMAIAGAEAELASGAWGEGARAFVASSALGDTFYVEFCGAPQPTLSGQIMRAMAIGARQAEALGSAVEAVGVSTLLCTPDHRETLYRAVVPLRDAAAFAASGDEGDISLARFQEEWQKSGD